MANQPTEAVIAGSKGFALALLAPLTERVGTRPRVAADAAQALKLTGGAGLVVVEFQGERSLESIRALVDGAAGLAVVAAVPDGHTGAEETLRSLGVEPARWDGKPDEVLSAVARRLALAAAEPAPAEPAPASAHAPPDHAPAAPSAVATLFDGEGLETPEPASAPGPSQPHASGPGGDWPSAVPGAADAGDALAAAIRGVLPPPGSPLAVVADVVFGLSPIERAVLLGEPQVVDPEPIRKAAVMRVRVAVALVTAPRAGAAVDAAAVSALLAEIDGLLSHVNALVAAAPPELQPSLEQVRNALVKEAIDFSEAAHPAEGGEAPPEVPPHPIPTAAERRASHTRILSLASKQEQALEHAAARRRRTAWIVLAVVAAGAAGFHGYRWWRWRSTVEGPVERATRAGVPPDATVLPAPAPGAPIVIRTRGRPFTPEELRRIEDEEALRGNAVRRAGPSTLVVVPGKR